MSARILRRAAAGAVSLLIVASLVAYADTVPGDGDSITPGNQSLRDLGSASPGEVLVVQVTFSLTCAGLTHAAAGSTITLAFDSATVPGDGEADATGTTIAVPDNWISTGGCPSPIPTVPAASPVTVSLTMPSTPGDNQDFTLMWTRSGSTGLS